MNLFDHIKGITEKPYDRNYWKKLSEQDKKSFNCYMIHRFLSMNMDWIEIVNIFQQYSYGIPSELVYKFYSSALPKQKIFLKYIKKKSDGRNKQLNDFLSKYFEVSIKEVENYLDILLLLPDGKELLKTLLKSYGIQKMEVKKLLKGI